MITELYIAVAAILGIIVGMGIGIKGRKERDNTIAALEQDLQIKRNVCESQNETISRLRKKLDKRNAKETD
jgi:hypothetical protein